MKYFADKANAVLKAINGLRPTDSNKGTFGHAYIIGGSLQYSGAPYLTYSASSAYRGGIGYAHLALPRSLIPSFMLKDPQAIIAPIPSATRQKASLLVWALAFQKTPPISLYIC